MREYLEDLIAAVRAAQEQGLADNSPEMVEAVRTELEPAYGTWGMFAEWLPLNIEGLLRIWADRKRVQQQEPHPRPNRIAFPSSRLSRRRGGMNGDWSMVTVQTRPFATLLQRSRTSSFG